MDFVLHFDVVVEPRLCQTSGLQPSHTPAHSQYHFYIFRFIFIVSVWIFAWMFVTAPCMCLVPWMLEGILRSPGMGGTRQREPLGSCLACPHFCLVPMWKLQLNASLCPSGCSFHLRYWGNSISSGGNNVFSCQTEPGILSHISQCEQLLVVRVYICRITTR